MQKTVKNLFLICQSKISYFFNSGDKIFIIRIFIIFSGCFARAQHFGKKIVELVRRQNNNAIFNDPYKHYMFGSLVSHVKEMGKKIREVTWDNHVAPIVKLRDNALYILDPLVSNRPMKRDEYHSALESTGSKIKGYVTCQPDTYGHEDDCFNPDKMEGEKLKTHNELTSMHLMM